MIKGCEYILVKRGAAIGPAVVKSSNFVDKLEANSRRAAIFENFD